MRTTWKSKTIGTATPPLSSAFVLPREPVWNCTIGVCRSSAAGLACESSAPIYLSVWPRTRYHLVCITGNPPHDYLSCLTARRASHWFTCTGISIVLLSPDKNRRYHNPANYNPGTLILQRDIVCKSSDILLSQNDTKPRPATFFCRSVVSRNDTIISLNGALERIAGGVRTHSRERKNA